jgi:DNA-binding MarR family transcriptional regulator
MEDDFKAKTTLHTKWGECINAGWLALPGILLVKQKDLNLSCTEIVILENMLFAWWTKESRPYIRSATIAKRMGIHQRSVQRGLNSLIKKGFVSRKVESAHKTTKGARPLTSNKELWTSYDVRPTVGLLNSLWRQSKLMPSDGTEELGEGVT